MDFIATEIPDVLLLKPTVHRDERGFFMEIFQANSFSSAGIPTKFVQDNLSGSHRGVLRGLHYQIQSPQGKLIRVVRGTVFDVSVDLRLNSPTLGKWVGVALSAERRDQLWIPPGFAHGYYVLSDWAEITYKATEFYSADHERILIWNDPQVAINWPLLDGKAPIVSPKDARGKPINKLELFDSFSEARFVET